ncbi:MAG: O-antigen/teichoic acid export membrane protein [Candidatus Paceibacteria bacterium]|jgi:O-antigen/teichoic acid export membrane protein
MRALFQTISDKLEKRFNTDARYFLNGGFWLTLGQVFITTFGLATTVLFAHFLSETDYGIYRYLIGLAVIFSLFSLTGLDQAILQTAAKKYYGFYQKTLKINLIYSLPITGIAMIGAGYYWFNENTILAVGCLLIAILQPIISTFRFVPVFLHGSRRFKESTIVHTVRMLVISVFSIIALFLTQNILILFAVYLSGLLITNFVSHLIFKPKTEGVAEDIVTKYLNYAKHTSIRNIIGNAAYRLDSVIIFTQLGAVELAIYTIANIVPEQIKATFKGLASLILPKYAQQDDVELTKKNIPKRGLQLFIIFSIITFLYIALSPFLYTLLFPKYDTAIFFSQLAALSLPAMVAILPCSLLQAHRKERELHSLNIQSSVVTILLTLVLIPSYGLIGAIVAKILSRYFNLALSFFLVYKLKSR